MDDVLHAANFFSSCVQLVDMAVLLQASVALFQAVPGSVTLPLYPRHSAGEAMLRAAVMQPLDVAWGAEGPPDDVGAVDTDQGSISGMRASCDHSKMHEELMKRTQKQWSQCGWWWSRAATKPTPPLISVDDLLSFRSRCFVLDVRSPEEYAESHFQNSLSVRNPVGGDLESIVPYEVLSMGAAPHEMEADALARAAPPWLFGFDPTEEAPVLRVRLVVVVGAAEDYGATFAGRLLAAGVRHVVCLLGGVTALRADAASYLVSD
eukprot:gnl/TRDRNA2_/TRDRNA2_161523_c3_seq1.p1 gnl/TRDRNA2_/TRDRNA2_161523_c3~~gnl/TRDRNA2_/TRDRNA2_161523_c3_seq1.p1  ORF type:complete len:264 (+),score=42.14 gnl/TRDRNA2_/TRDRNA2_161523_c3_seq1:3-794(+)